MTYKTKTQNTQNPDQRQALQRVHFQPNSVEFVDAVQIPEKAKGEWLEWIGAKGGDYLVRSGVDHFKVMEKAPFENKYEVHS